MSTDLRPTGRPASRVITIALLGIVGALAAFPGVAAAHGPVAPVASSYLARVGRVPAGIQAKVVDGDQRMWLSVSPAETVVVLDYRGAPYLRFLGSGVQVNHNSAMYYLNRTPAEIPPVGLSRTTAPRWTGVTGGRDYAWHDGRLHALATVALAPGASYVGRWTIPLVVDGRLTAISGGLWHANDPSVVWFWVIAVLFACVLAAWRLRRRRLDVALARALAIAALTGLAAGGVGRELYGRPTVSIFQLIVVALIVAFVIWGFGRALVRGPGYFSMFMIAFAALWVGGLLLPTLWHGYVLASVPAFVARTATVVSLGAGAGLLLLVFRLAGYAEDDERPSDQAEEPSEREGVGVRETVS